MSDRPERIVLGSGDLYTTEFVGSMPSDATIETTDNQIGFISGGATLEYKPTFYEAKDDLGCVSKTILTEEEATLKSGILTFNGPSLKKMCSTARVTTSGARRTVKIGGTANQDGKYYIIRFVHKDSVDGDIRLTIVGRNEAGFSMAFAKDKETVIDAEFKAMPNKLDKEGTLIQYDEETAGTTYPVSIDADINTTIEVKSGTAGNYVYYVDGSTVAAGTVLTITATYASGYSKDSLTVNGTAFTSASTHTVSGAVTIVATDKPTV